MLDAVPVVERVPVPDNVSLGLWEEDAEGEGASELEGDGEAVEAGVADSDG